MSELLHPCSDNQPLAPEELGALVRQMVEAETPAKVNHMQEKIIRGFYGGESCG